jgi:hypothetical protein
MRVVRQILVGLGLIVIGVGGVVLAQGIVILTGSQSGQVVQALAITILGALLLVGGVVLLVKGIRKRPPALSGSGI